MKKELKTPCIIGTGTTDKSGYKIRTIDCRTSRVHRSAYEDVYGPIPKGLCVLHECDNPPCCNPDHLFLGTRGDNAADRNAKGRQARGEKHGSAKLTGEKVNAIRVDSRLHREIAADYGVAVPTIADIKAGRSWGWMK